MRLTPGPGMKRLEGRLDVNQARETAKHITLKTPLRPSLGVILGSGWSPVAEAVTQAVSLNYQDIPHFHKPRVRGHSGCLVIGLMSGRPVALLSGRPHLYEGHSISDVAFPVVALREMGVRDLVLTNAAGGLNQSLLPGDIMIISDHINLPGLVGTSPLVGIEGAFVDMGEAYDPALIEFAGKMATSTGKRAHVGVYAMVGGPTYETPAEARLLRALGADAVGMSTAPEVVAARWAGMRVLAMSLITNNALEPGAGLTHQQVLHAAEEESPRLRLLISRLVEAWPE